MPNGKSKTTPNAIALAATRNSEALEIALSFIDQMYNGLKVIAIHNIELLVLHLSAYWPPAMLMGHSPDHVTWVVEVVEQIKDCLNLVDGSLAVRTTGAYERLWLCQNQDGCIGHKQFLKEIGMNAMWTTCVLSIQDAIGMAMLREPAAFQQVVDNDDFSMNTRSKLRQSYFIMKRKLLAVGRHIEQFGKETDAEHGPIRPPTP
jgi:hypothetical protein